MLISTLFSACHPPPPPHTCAKASTNASKETQKNWTMHKHSIVNKCAPSPPIYTLVETNDQHLSSKCHETCKSEKSPKKTHWVKFFAKMKNKNAQNCICEKSYFPYGPPRGRQRSSSPTPLKKSFQYRKVISKRKILVPKLHQKCLQMQRIQNNTVKAWAFCRNKSRELHFSFLTPISKQIFCKK